MRTYDFKTADYFPFHVILVGAGLVVIGISMVTMGLYPGGLIVLLISILLLTTHYRFHINFDTNEYRDYVWVLGLKNGKTIRFETIDYIFIKQNRKSQTMG